jgi:protein-L-isoaspartate(D-aspartate) O-methyltransferase
MNFEQARFNMIEQQIRTWEVLDQATLDTLAAVKREDFVPAPYRAMAFSDLEIPLNVDGAAPGEVMFAPKLEARLLQELTVKPTDTILEIGAGSGYMAALLASRGQTVQTWERQPALAAFARANLSRGGMSSVTVREGDGFAASHGANAFDVILLSGAVERLPEDLFESLKLGGRFIAIVGQAPVMSAVLVTRTGEDQFTQVKLFETLTTLLVGGPTVERFRF